MQKNVIGGNLCTVSAKLINISVDYCQWIALKMKRYIEQEFSTDLPGVWFSFCIFT